MGRFLAIYHGVADEAEKAGLSEERQADFMNAWAAWAREHEAAIVDGGAPLFRKKRVTAAGSRDFTDTQTGYAIVEADSHDDAVRIFAGHPHLRLAEGNWIDVLEIPG